VKIKERTIVKRDVCEWRMVIMLNAMTCDHYINNVISIC
jgi:hypothetical protein